jgi:hypothetical protein
VYRDPTTFRTVIYPVGTQAAFAALPATYSVTIIGTATAVTYNLARRVAEKMRVPGPSRPLADHL